MTVVTAIDDYQRFGAAELFTYPFDPSWLLTFMWTVILVAERHPWLRALAALNLILSLGVSFVEWQPGLIRSISDQLALAVFLLVVLTAWFVPSDYHVQHVQFFVAGIVVWVIFIAKYLLCCEAWLTRRWHRLVHSCCRFIRFQQRVLRRSDRLLPAFAMSIFNGGWILASLESAGVYAHPSRLLQDPLLWTHVILLALFGTIHLCIIAELLRRLVVWCRDSARALWLVSAPFRDQGDGS